MEDPRKTEIFPVPCRKGSIRKQLELDCIVSKFF